MVSTSVSLKPEAVGLVQQDFVDEAVAKVGQRQQYAPGQAQGDQGASAPDGSAPARCRSATPDTPAAAVAARFSNVHPSPATSAAARPESAFVAASAIAAPASTPPPMACRRPRPVSPARCASHLKPSILAPAIAARCHWRSARPVAPFVDTHHQTIARANPWHRSVPDADASKPTHRRSPAITHGEHACAAGTASPYGFAVGR